MIEIGSNRHEHVFTRNPLVGCCQHCGKNRSDCEKRFQPDQDEAYEEDCAREYVEVVLHNQPRLEGLLSLYPVTDDAREDVCNDCGQNYAECWCAAKRDSEGRAEARLYRERDEWRHEAAEQQRLK